MPLWSCAAPLAACVAAFCLHAPAHAQGTVGRESRSASASGRVEHRAKSDDDGDDFFDRFLLTAGHGEWVEGSGTPSCINVPQPWRPPGQQPCPDVRPDLPPPSTTPDLTDVPPVAPLPEQPEQMPLDQLFAMTGQAALGAGAQFAAPAMIGDFFGLGVSSASIIPIQPFGVRTTLNNGLPVSPTFNDDVTFTTSPSVVNGVTIPGATFSAGDAFQLPDASTLPLTGGAAAVSALDSANVAAFGAGTSVLDRIEADRITDSGFPGLSSDDEFLIDVYQTFNPAPGTGILIDIPSPSAGGGVVGRIKMAENSSPMPRDRIFFNYSYFHNVPLFPGGVDVNRFTPGFEKTFLDGMASFEMAVPFATTLDSNIFADGATDTSNMEFGNLTMALKGLLYRSEYWATSAGLAVAVPTASDIRVQTVGGTPLARIDNQSVHLMPFIGSLYTPNDRFFAQGFMQFDVAANGNPVYVNTTGAGLERVGRQNDPAFLYSSIGAGYWLYRSPNPYVTGLTGMAGMAELHYSRSLESTDVITAGNFRIGSHARNVDVLNVLVGTSFWFGHNKSLALAYATPIGNSTDRAFDGEFRLMLNWYFGPMTRQTQAF
jgi:hypothetical protein